MKGVDTGKTPQNHCARTGLARQNTVISPRWALARRAYLSVPIRSRGQYANTALP